MDVLLAATDLLEAEGRSLKRNALRTSMAIGLALVAVVLLLAALGFFLAAVYLLAASRWGGAGGALAASLAALLLAGLFLWLALRTGR